MTRPVFLSENSRSALMAAAGGQVDPNKLPQFVAAFVSTLSAVSLGMVFTWTSSALPIMEKEIGITNTQGAWIGSLVTLGAFLGAIPAGSLAHTLGRKRTLQVVIVPFFMSWICIAFLYQNLVVVYFARFIAGLAVGAVSVAAPIYVAELAHISIRGTLGTFFQVQITIGIFLEYLLGELISDIQTLSLASSILPLIFLLSFAFVPESPVYLCEIGNTEEAKKSLTWFRGSEYDTEDELVKIMDNIKEVQNNKVNLFDLFNCRATFKGLIISFGLMTFQQLSGVNAVLFYANTIFQKSGGLLSPGASSILVGAVQVFATLGSTALIDRTGRKILLLVSDFVMCLSLATIGSYFSLSEIMDLSAFSFIPLVSTALFIIFFSIGYGPIPWMIMGEIFAPKNKGVASSLSASLNWFLAFMVTNQFANLVYWLGIGPTFLVFSVICGMGTVFVTFLVPETKGKSIEEVTSIILGEKSVNFDSFDKTKMTTSV